MTSDSRLQGGPGWYIDRETLLPGIEDEDLFRAAHANDPAVEILVALWTGNPEQAEAEIRRRFAEAETPRLRALLADAWRDQGRTDDAIAAYEELVCEVAGTGHEAVMQQHLGKALFVAGRYDEAARVFEQAYELRTAAGAEPALVNSAKTAAERAREAASATR